MEGIMMKKRIMSVTLALCLLLPMLTVNVQAATIVASGDCRAVGPSGPQGTAGKELTWTLNSDGLLTVQGQGSMADYFYNGVTDAWTVPWKEHKDDIIYVQIGQGVKTIGKYAFQGCKKMISVSIPDSVTSIHPNAFRWCSGLTSVTIPDTVKYIDEGTFNGCTSLRSVGLPDQLISIGASAFASCSSLTAVSLPDSVTTIEKAAFSMCTSLSSINIPDSVTAIGESAFYKTSLSTVTIPKGVTTIANDVFSKCGSLTEVIISEGVTTICNGAFTDCSNLTTVHLPWSVKEIYGQPFSQCPKLKNVYYGGSERSYQNIKHTGELFSADTTIHYTKLYTVTYDPKDGTIEGSKEPVVVEAGPDGTTSGYAPWPDTRECYTCKGWYTADGKSLPAVLTQDITLYPKWTENHTPVSVPATPATCGAPGKTSGKSCSVCGEVLEGLEPIPATGEHTPGENQGEEITQSATCTENGKKDVTYTCAVCNQEFTKEETIPATGIHTERIVPGKAATCTETGLTEGKQCSVCHTTLVEQKEIPLAAHTEVIVDGKAATCTETGLTEGKKCSVCGATIVEQKEIPRTEHQWKITYSDVIEPTCKAEGLKITTKECICGETKTEKEVIPKTGHTWESEIKTEKEPTCTEEGYQQLRRTCSVCHKVEEEFYGSIAPTGHTEKIVPAVAATCTTPGLTEGKQCSVCDEITTPQKEIPALGHAWAVADGEEKITKQPTCTQPGEKTITGGSKCSRCDAVSADTKTVTIPALGHDWGAETSDVTKEATCTDAGSITRTKTCQRTDCTAEETKEDTIPALGHNWGVETSDVTKKATCTEEGTKTYTRTCESCKTKETIGEETIPALGHEWGEWTVTKPATDTEKGTETRTCSVCGYTETKDIPATGDKPSGGDEKPSEGGDKPGGGDEKPDEGGDKPSGGDDKPSGGDEKPSEGDDKPSGGDKTDPPAPTVTYWSIYTHGTSGGSYHVSHDSAAQGTRITVSFDPRSGYELDDLRVTDRGTGQRVSLTERYSDEYYFTMPASSVDVDISFARIQAGNVHFDIVPPKAKAGPVAWYYRDRHIYHVTNGLVPDFTPITRDMLISVLYNMTDESLIPSQTAGSETNDAHVWATVNDIIPDIYASGLWGMDRSLDRDQAVLLVFNYARYQGLNVSQRANITRYTDYSRVRPVARDAMSWAIAAGLMNDTSATQLSPKSVLNCGQIGDILYRFETTAARGR